MKSGAGTEIDVIAMNSLEQRSYRSASRGHTPRSGPDGAGPGPRRQHRAVLAAGTQPVVPPGWLVTASARMRRKEFSR